MKVIFLDIDGVLNHQYFYTERSGMDTMPKYPFSEFCPVAVKNLNQLIEATGAKVVVSSSWRTGRTTEQLQELLNSVGFKGNVIGKTGNAKITISFNYGFSVGNESASSGSESVPRGVEIQHWLSTHGFLRVNWGEKALREMLEKSRVKNYVILDDDTDMLYNQREHFVKCNAYKGGFDADALKKATEILNTDILTLYEQDI